MGEIVVGTTVGGFVGIIVGVMLGVIVGIILGNIVGNFVGIIVGLSVGIPADPSSLAPNSLSFSGGRGGNTAMFLSGGVDGKFRK